MNRKIIFFDIDGTLATHREDGVYVSPKVIEAIKETRNKGHLCFIASGRPLPFLQQWIKDIDFDGYVLANGSHLVYQGETLNVEYLNYDLLCHMMHVFEKEGIEYVMSSSKNAYIPAAHHTMTEFFHRVGGNKNLLISEFNMDEILQDIIKVEIWCHTSKQLELARELIKDFYYEEHPDGHSIEITGLHINKSTGIKKLFELLNINKEDSYCFGDGPNDFEMFEAVGCAIAMGNAIEDLKKVAHEICLSVDEDGVAHKLNELFK